MSALTVGDVFCGAGGFSEGFRQAGFEMRWALDLWPPAVETFRKNHPTSKVVHADIRKIAAADLEPVDVLIGSPPCTHFSLANRGGGGDKEAGLELVWEFLRLVRDLGPRYWVMENVPHLQRTLEEFLDGDAMPLPGGPVEVPFHQVLMAADYGAPQRRRRLFSGSYPASVPKRTDFDGGWIPLGTVVRALPDPCNGSPGKVAQVNDPLYPGLQLPVSRFTDHFEDTRTRMTRDDIRQCRQMKQHHRVYGRMDFPDPLDRPSRTITATRPTKSRSTIAVVCPHHKRRVVRTLTLRECASVQGFPISYQFWGDSFGKKEHLIGNAVPPPVARAIAEAILANEGLPVPHPPIIHKVAEIPEPLRSRRRGAYRYSIDRRFRGYVRADWSPECRVELDNSGRRPGKHPLTGKPHQRQWVARLYLGYAKEYRCYEVPLGQALRVLKSTTKYLSNPSQRKAMTDLFDAAHAQFIRWLPDATTLQANWARRTVDGISPEEVLHRVEDMLDRRLPSKSWRRISIPRAAYSEILTPLLTESGADASSSPPRDMTARTLGALLLVSLACELVNDGRHWISKHGKACFVPEET